MYLCYLGRKSNSSDQLASHFFWTFPSAPKLFIECISLRLLTILKVRRENLRETRYKVKEFQRDGEAYLGKVMALIIFYNYLFIVRERGREGES